MTSTQTALTSRGSALPDDIKSLKKQKSNQIKFQPRSDQKYCTLKYLLNKMVLNRFNTVAKKSSRWPVMNFYFFEKETITYTWFAKVWPDSEGNSVDFP